MSKLNRIVDKYFYNLHGLDVYMVKTDSSYRGDILSPTILVHLDKFLTKGSDFNPIYHNLLSSNNDRLLNETIYEGLSFLGVNELAIKNGFKIGDIRFKVAEDKGRYFDDYVNKVCELMNMYTQTDYYEFRELDKAQMSNFKLKNVMFWNDSDFSLGQVNVDISFTGPKGFYEEDSAYDYLANNMEVDPNISLAFYNFE